MSIGPTARDPQAGPVLVSATQLAKGTYNGERKDQAGEALTHDLAGSKSGRPMRSLQCENCSGLSFKFIQPESLLSLEDWGENITMSRICSVQRIISLQLSSRRKKYEEDSLVSTALTL